MFSFTERAHAIDAGLNHLLHRNHFTLQLHLSGGETLDIQEDLEHTRNALGFRVDLYGELLAFFFVQ